MKRIIFFTLLLVLLGILTSCLVSDAESISEGKDTPRVERVSVGWRFLTINDFRTYITTDSRNPSDYEYQAGPRRIESLLYASSVQPYYTPLENIFPVSEEWLQSIKEISCLHIYYDTPPFPVIGIDTTYFFDEFCVSIDRAPDLYKPLSSVEEFYEYNNSKYPQNPAVKRKTIFETLAYEEWLAQTHEERSTWSGYVVRQTDKVMAQYRAVNGNIKFFEVMIQDYRIVITFVNSYEDFLAAPDFETELFRPFFSEDDAVFEEALNALAERLS